jgi:aerobic-type carbon monoxide dehydrogenase small subunit (CoxS/CutS family)
MKKNTLIKVLVLLTIILSFQGYSTTYYSIASTGWNTPSTWSTAACGGAAAITTPGSGDDVIICAGTTVIMNGSSGACNSLTINGVANWTSALTTNVGNGGITINVGGDITGSSAGILTTTGGLVLNSTLTSTAVTIKTITTAGQTISGTGSLAKLDISANTTNNGNITVSTTLASTVSSTLTQGASATLRFNGTTISPILDASTAGNTVQYGGATQTIRSATYHHLTILGSAIKTLGGDITVNGNLQITAGQLYTSTFQITGNASGTFTMAAGALLTIGNNASATNVNFPTNFTTPNISFAATSSVYYSGNNAQTISSVPTYGNLTIQVFSGSKAADGTINVTGTLTTSSPASLDMSSFTLNVTGSYIGTGGLLFSNGTFNLTGTNTNSGTFTCGTGTVNYNGATQTVKSTTYNHLTINGSGTKTLGGAITINGNLAITAGELYTSTYQITGNATGTFTMAASSLLTIGNNGSATNVSFPTNFTTPNISFSGTSTVYYNGNNAQTISSTPSYGNLTIQTFSGSKTADGNLTLTGNLVVTSPSALSMTSYTLNVTGTYTSSGALSFTSGDFNIGGTFTNTGTFTCGSGTVNYNGAGAQTVRGVNYTNLTFSGAGAKTLQASSTIGIAGTFVRGTMTVTAGSSNTVLFNGTSQNMTGNAITFYNLTINNTSLTIPADIIVSFALTLTGGTIITGANSVIISQTGSVSRTSGFVNGKLNKYVAGGTNVTRTFEIGTGSDYTPIVVLFASVTGTGTLTASSTASDHPSIATSGFNASLTVNRYWTLTNSGIIFTTYSATCTFVNADKDAGLSTSTCIIKTYNGSSWAVPASGTQGANSTQATGLTTPTSSNTIYLQIGEQQGSSSGSLYSIATGNWNTPGTWSSTSGGASCTCVPTVLDDVFIENNFIVTMDGAPGAAKSLTITTGGVATLTSATTTNIGTGGITITATGDITGAAAGLLTNKGNLTINKVLTNTSFTLRMAAGTGQTISGTGGIALLDISVATTNNGAITISRGIQSNTLSTLTQGVGASIILTSTASISAILDASASGNTVSYNGTNQTVKAATYYNLTINGSVSGLKTLAGTTTVNGNLTITSGYLATSTFQLTGNATGTFSMSANTIFYIGDIASATDVTFPSGFTNANISFSGTSTVYYNGNNAQTVSSVPSYGNLTVQTFSGSKTANGTITVTGNLSVVSPTTLNMSTRTLNLTGNYTGTGALSFTSGTFNIAGAYSNTGSFTCGTGTVNYNGGSGQTIRGVNYNNLTFSGAGTKTLQAAATIGIAGNFARGTMTVTPGATNIVLFNGTVQNMTGNATSFTSVTVNNTSLTIAGDITINSTLTFTAGNIITNGSTVIIASSGSVSRTSGYVNGNLRKNVALGSNVSRTFEIGTATDYTPLDFVFANVSTAGDLTTSATAGDHPSIATSGFNPSLTVNRYWTVVNSGIVFTNYDVTATFIDTDEDAGLNTTISVIRIYDGATWSLPAAGTQAANSTQATGVTIPVTPNTVYLQIGQKTSSTGNVYSIASNNWTNPATWSETSGGPSCSCLPTSVDNAFIENNFTVTMDANSGSAKSLSISTGGVANWAAPYTTNIGTNGIDITATGDITGSASGILTTSGGFILNTTLTSTAVTIQTITTPGQTISGIGTLPRLDINVNTSNDGDMTLTDVLTISSGTFTNNGTFTLKSDATKYARIAPVTCGGCGFSGNFTIERYIPSRSIGTWADLSSPVTNSTMQDWDNELFMVYPFGTYDPNTGRPTNSSVLAYDEPSAYYYELNSATALTAGMGFEIGITDDANNTGFTAKAINTIGTPNVGTVDIPLSFTASNGPAYPVGYSGENLIGNPFASAVALSGITITNALSTVDVYDYTIDNYTTLTSSDIIGPSQGFWVYAQGSGASVSIPETAKSTNSNTALYRSTAKDKNAYLNLTLSSADGSNMMAHTLKVACNENASDKWDTSDHPFRKSLNPKAPSITANAGEAIVSINTFNSNHETYVMPLNLKIAIDGKYQLNTSGIKNIRDFAVVLLEDKLTHTFINLNNSNYYTFNSKSTDSQQRFALHFSKSSTYAPVSTDIANNLSNDVEILQNSNGNTINFNLAKTENTVISVMDLLGKNIMENMTVEANNQSINITLPESFHGLYFITIQSPSGKTVKKFVTVK